MDIRRNRYIDISRLDGHGMKQTKITKSAKGEDCSVRLPTICSFDNDKTILAHIGTSFSAPNRAHDFHACYCCSDCHDVVDNRVKSDFSSEDLLTAVTDAMMETQNKLIAKGLVIIK